MEQWEIDLRAKLEKELPDGAYQLEDKSSRPDERKLVVWTGKGGQINYLVELERAIRDYLKDK